MSVSAKPAVAVQLEYGSVSVAESVFLYFKFVIIVLLFTISGCVVFVGARGPMLARG